MKSNSYAIFKSEGSVSASKDLICLPSCWPISQKACHLMSSCVICIMFVISKPQNHVQMSNFDHERILFLAYTVKLGNQELFGCPKIVP